MKELKITKGEFSVNEKEVENIGGEYSAKVMVMSEDRNELHAKTFGWSKEEALSNADLISETFTVANECGKTPRELLEQRDELLEALKTLLNIDINNPKERHEAGLKAVYAIKNCEPTSKG